MRSGFESWHLVLLTQTSAAIKDVSNAAKQVAKTICCHQPYCQPNLYNLWVVKISLALASKSQTNFTFTDHAQCLLYKFSCMTSLL